MRSVRVLAMVAIAGLLAAGVLIDLPDRPVPDRPVRYLSALAAPAGVVSTWFCPGGSGPDGAAELTIGLASGSDQWRTAAVSVLPGGSDPSEARTVDVEIEPRGSVLLKTVRGGSRRPAGSAWWSRWTAPMSWSSRYSPRSRATWAARPVSPGRPAAGWCHTARPRSAVEGERFIVMLLNPFPDIAVADIELVADVGRDTIDGLVVPAQRVVAVDITDEITVATSVAAFVDVVSGRLAASWIQVADGPIARPRCPGISRLYPGAAPQWHLPVAAVGAARQDVVAIANPSADIAEVDLEILAEAPGTDVSPIEITVRPGRTALVDLSQQGRLVGIGPFSVVVRSLDDAPVAASIHSVTFAADARRRRRRRGRGGCRIHRDDRGGRRGPPLAGGR